MAKENANLTQSLCKAFDILNCFTPETPALRISDITKRVGMTQSSVSRLVGTMVAYGYLERMDDTGCYQLGRQIISLSSVALNHSELRRQALPELYRLEQEYEVGANLAVLEGSRMYYLAHVDSRTSPRMYTMVGYTKPLHCTAIGKVLLAAMPDQEIARIAAEEGLPKYTVRTVTTLDQLMEQVEKIRRVGYATEYDERVLGAACIAAPIYGRSGQVVAGLSISGKFLKCALEEREAEAAPIVMEAAMSVSKRLGCI